MGKDTLSPCVKICRIDQFTGECIGCGRTRKQIAQWPRMSYHERSKAMERLLNGRTSTQNRMAREAESHNRRTSSKHRK